MTRKSRWMPSIGLVILTTLLLTGCTKANGGGWITSQTGTGKATFGFNGKCRDRMVNGQPTAVISSQVEYKDAPAGVQFHGSIASTTFQDNTCAQLSAEFDPPGGSTFIGSYKPQPQGATGVFFLSVQDNGEPGIEGDEICVQLVDGAYSGYAHCGTIRGGNIQVH